MDKKLKKKLVMGTGVGLIGISLLFALGIFLPKSFGGDQSLIYDARKGLGGDEIAQDLENQGIIHSSLLFDIYAFISGNRSKLQAGLYEFSPSMSIAGIINKLASGDVAKHKITILAGWDGKDIYRYFEKKGIYTKKDVVDAMKADFYADFEFLKSKPKTQNLEGYIFPDTYMVPVGTHPVDFVRMTLKNFDKKLTPALRKKIAADKRTIYQVVTMASIIEKEVASLDDKKTVSGILWKRLANGMPLQVDSTINFITDKNDVSATFADLKIDSKYNTYKYTGLPLGPISSPGMDSIIAAIYPTKSEYWFYLSASDTGKTIFSKTYQEHKAAMAKYLKSLSVK